MIRVRLRGSRVPHRHDPQKQDRSGSGAAVRRVQRLETRVCAVAAVEAWLAIREEKKGALFVAFYSE